jgi:hypothetical protein
VAQFNDKYWEGLVSTADYQLTAEGRLVFEYKSNHLKVNLPFNIDQSVSMHSVV